MVFRNNTYIHSIISIELINISGLNFFGDSFVRYYLPDFLWGYSLAMAFYGLFLPKLKSSFCIVVIVVLAGISWELLQFIKPEFGTFDLLDCLMYLVSALISNYIYFIGEKKK